LAGANDADSWEALVHVTIVDELHLPR
jgi:hypothetical protein